MGIEQTAAPEYRFTCDACGTEVASTESAGPPADWHVVNTTETSGVPPVGHQVLIGPTCAAAGVTLTFGGEQWTVARAG